MMVNGTKDPVPPLEKTMSQSCPKSELRTPGGDEKPIEIGLGALFYRDSDEFRNLVGMEVAQAQFNRGKKACSRLNEHQSLSSGFGRPMPSIDGMNIIDDIDAGCELLIDESSRDPSGFLWRCGG